LPYAVANSAGVPLHLDLSPAAATGHGGEAYNDEGRLNAAPVCVMSEPV
jgi:hypothetical protein